MNPVDLLREAIHGLPRDKEFGVEVSADFYSALRADAAACSALVNEEGRETVFGLPVRVSTRPSTVDYGFTVHEIPPGWDFYS